MLIYISVENISGKKADLKIKMRLSCSGIIVPGGFGDRGVEGKILAAEWARKTKKPYLGEKTMITEILSDIEAS